SGPATVAALGATLIPAMANAGYEKSTAAALMSTAGAIGIVIPPSITFVVYGSVTGTGIGALFMSGIVPGILIGVVIYFAMKLTSRGRELHGTPKATGKERLKAFWSALGGIMMPVIILGGIYGGIFTPTEAAAVAAVYGFIVGIFIYRTINSVKMLFEIFSASMQATAVVMIVVTCAGLYSWVASTVGLVERGSALLLSVSDDPWIVLLMINIILLLAGMLLDAISIYYVFLPFMLPIMSHFQWDPIWFGIMMTVNLAVGQVTPPVAVNLYVGANISGLTMEEISKAALPLIGAAILALVLIVLFPGLSTFMPRLLGLS
ncbi:TRAP transporter large permease, partial [uncultured Desulfovibrio sp.]|uniref:TRAP transporter large permease n=1 Tax=uncultured Desulfovibrio sp. TaxID=167968 RepID=UPI0026018FFB